MRTRGPRAARLPNDHRRICPRGSPRSSRVKLILYDSMHRVVKILFHRLNRHHRPSCPIVAAESGRLRVAEAARMASRIRRMVSQPLASAPVPGAYSEGVRSAEAVRRPRRRPAEPGATRHETDRMPCRNRRFTPTISTQAERFYRDVLGLTPLGKEAGRHVFFQVGRPRPCCWSSGPRRPSAATAYRPTGPRAGPFRPRHRRRGSRGLAAPAGASIGWRSSTRRPGRRGGHSLYFRDPAGNSVELITPGVWGLPSGW